MEVEVVDNNMDPIFKPSRKTPEVIMARLKKMLRL